MRRDAKPLAIEVELQREKASGLGRVASRLEALLASLAGIEQRARTARGIELDRLCAEHAQLRQDAEKQRWYLVVQREAMGLTKHHDVERIYPLPPPLKPAAGAQAAPSNPDLS